MYVTNQILTYVAECVRLLYWIYFKPYTFRRWLKDIHPDLKPDTNPFTKKSEFQNNPRLRRYAYQVWCLTALSPLVAALVVAPIYTLVSGETFNWFNSYLYSSGWFI
ncbi:MAG TPA: AAA family ATPase, partial [Nostocaceae cyanobacterium]|nr:AAA family ATPase [Nostocaceae cyanobacterium]